MGYNTETLIYLLYKINSEPINIINVCRGGLCWMEYGIPLHYNTMGNPYTQTWYQVISTIKIQHRESMFCHSSSHNIWICNSRTVTHSELCLKYILSTMTGILNTYWSWKKCTHRLEKSKLRSKRSDQGHNYIKVYCYNWKPLTPLKFAFVYFRPCHFF